VLDELLKPGFIDGVREKGEYLKGQLEGLVKKHPKVYVEQRGMGFLQGMPVHPAVPAGDMVNRLQSLGMLVPPAAENVIRVFPALIADKAAIDEGIDILSKAAQSFEAAPRPPSRPWRAANISSTSTRSIRRRFARSSITARR
jgi:acetylornithine/succinyldiaminopimelate/putrescine aminotransferase